MTLLDSSVATTIQQSLLCSLSCTHLVRKVPDTRENLTQSGSILTAPGGWETHREWRNINDYRGAGGGNRTRVISLED